MQEPFDEVTAYHEAGHAVIALLLDRPVAEVSVLPNHQLLGHCKFGKSRYKPSEDWVEREMLIALGGIAAEARFTGGYVKDGAAKDEQYVRALAVERAGERRADRLQRRLFSKAEHLLSQESHWRAVTLIAQALVQQGTISGRTARHLFEQGLSQED